MYVVSMKCRSVSAQYALDRALILQNFLLTAVRRQTEIDWRPDVLAIRLCDKLKPVSRKTKQTKPISQRDE